MSSARKNRLSKRRFNNLKSAASDLKEAVDIDFLEGVTPEDVDFAELMFHRRHVYEHRGGVADEKYITDSDDKSVRLGQALHESAESAHRIASLILRMARNVNRGFHEIVPPDEETIRFHKRLSERTASSQGAGISAGLITTKGFGKSDPRAKGESSQARAANRRVEIGIVDSRLFFDSETLPQK